MEGTLRRAACCAPCPRLHMSCPHVWSPSGHGGSAVFCSGFLPASSLPIGEEKLFRRRLSYSKRSRGKRSAVVPEMRSLASSQPASCVGRPAPTSLPLDLSSSLLPLLPACDSTSVRLLLHTVCPGCTAYPAALACVFPHRSWDTALGLVSHPSLGLRAQEGVRSSETGCSVLQDRHRLQW